jgi:hypothetical protein
MVTHFVWLRISPADCRGIKKVIFIAPLFIGFFQIPDYVCSTGRIVHTVTEDFLWILVRLVCVCVYVVGALIWLAINWDSSIERSVGEATTRRIQCNFFKYVALYNLNGGPCNTFFGLLHTTGLQAKRTRSLFRLIRQDRHQNRRRKVRV